jgi:hypothetical protein
MKFTIQEVESFVIAWHVDTASEQNNNARRIPPCSGIEAGTVPQTSSNPEKEGANCSSRVVGEILYNTRNKNLGVHFQ